MRTTGEKSLTLQCRQAYGEKYRRGRTAVRRWTGKPGHECPTCRLLGSAKHEAYEKGHLRGLELLAKRCVARRPQEIATGCQAALSVTLAVVVVAAFCAACTGFTYWVEKVAVWAWIASVVCLATLFTCS